MNVLSADSLQMSNIHLCVVILGSRLCAGVDPSLQIDNRIQGSTQAVLPSSKHNKSRAANTRDERFRSGNLLVRAFFFLRISEEKKSWNTFLLCLSDLHTEAVQAALAKYKERKMPMPSKRRSVLVQSSVEACTPPGETLKLLNTQTHTFVRPPGGGSLFAASTLQHVLRHGRWGNTLMSVSILL